MQFQWLCTVILVTTIVVQVKSECTEEQLNKAQIVFKDCMDEKKASLLQTDVSDDKVHEVICGGLKDLSTGCMEPVSKFAICRGREFVDNLVAIHLNAMAGRLDKIPISFFKAELQINFCLNFPEVLAPFYPSVNMTACPVFHTPAPTVVHVFHTDHINTLHQHEDQPEYQPVTASAVYCIPAWVLVVTLVKIAL
jgi:hypothetical protein